MAALEIKKSTPRNVGGRAVTSGPRAAPKNKAKTRAKRGSGNGQYTGFVNRIVRYFSQFQRARTMTVLGAKRLTEAELRMFPLIAKRLCDDWQVIGVLEHAPTGPHVHAAVIDTSTSQPMALSASDTELYVRKLNTALTLMRESKTTLLPSRWLRNYERRIDRYDGHVGDFVYHVQHVESGGKRVQSGFGHFGAMYILKTLVQPDRRSEFVCETGVGGLYKWVRSHEEVDVQNQPVLTGVIKPFNLETMSFVAYAVAHQLESRKPEQVVVYTKNGHVIREHAKHPLKFKDNRLLHLGLERTRQIAAITS